jgi:hypothetical protein
MVYAYWKRYGHPFELKELMLEQQDEKCLVTGRDPHPKLGLDHDHDHRYDHEKPKRMRSPVCHEVNALNCFDSPLYLRRRALMIEFWNARHDSIRPAQATVTWYLERNAELIALLETR